MTTTTSNNNNKLFEAELIRVLKSINIQLNKIAISLDKIEAIKERETGIEPDEFKVT